METLIAVGAGGCLGALLRHGVVLWAPRLQLSESFQFPLGVVAVNLAGCLLLGLFKGVMDSAGLLNESTRLFLFTGVLGAFTTFSTFGAETMELIQHEQYLAALLYVLVSVCLGLVLVWAGQGACRSVFGAV